jgi:pSer/pThr/pTyr-binding forkhead associated (FHA) protein
MGVRLIVVSSSRVSREPGLGASAEGDAASLRGAESWEFAQGRVVLGRASAADVVLPHPSVSTRHASIEAEGVRYTITDHGSLNGTWVNGQRIVSERKKPLRDGDRIDVGLFTLRFVANVPVNDVPSREHTAAIAKRLLRAVRASEPRAARRLIITNGPDAGRAFELPAPPARVVLGRAETADVPLADGDASREHAELVIDAEGVLLRDLGSKNGVFVAERRVTERRLSDRDELRIGATILTLEDEGDPSLRALEALPDEPAPPPSLPPPPPSTPPPGSAPGAGTSMPDASAAAQLADAAPEAAPEPPPALASFAPSEAGLPAPREVPLPSATPRRAGLGTAEWLVYALALLVFALSAAGLVWLLRAG